MKSRVIHEIQVYKQNFFDHLSLQVSFTFLFESISLIQEARMGE